LTYTQLDVTKDTSINQTTVKRFRFTLELVL